MIFPLAVYPKARGSTPSRSTVFGNCQVLPKARASGRLFLPCAGPVKRGQCRPSTSRAAAAAPPPASAHALQRTLGLAHGAVPHSVAGPLAHVWRTHRSNPGPHTGCRARRSASAAPSRMASQDSHERPVPQSPPRPPPSQHVAHTAHAPAPHITEVRSPSRRQDGAAEVPQSDEMEVDLATEVRPHAHPPARPRPARVAPWAAPHTAAHEPLHALTPWAFALRRISTRTRRGRHSKRTRASGMRNNRGGGRLRRKSAQGRSISRPRAAQGLSSPQRGWR